MNQSEKDLLQSKTFWGLVVAAVAAVCSHFGITLNQAAWVNDAVIVAGGLFSVYGRLVAKTPVTSALFLTTKKAKDETNAQS